MSYVTVSELLQHIHVGNEEEEEEEEEDSTFFRDADNLNLTRQYYNPEYHLLN
jgi:hypothetical protein